MNFILIPSLKHLALIKVTTTLWNLCSRRESQLKSSTGYSDYSSKYIALQVVKDKVMEKVPELPLPELLKKEILYYIQPICSEMCNWKNFLCVQCFFYVCLSEDELTKLSVPCWTPQGTVDQKKTAKAFIKDDNLDITNRYILACNFCLENDVKELWNSLPQTKKVAFYDEGHSNFSDPLLTLTVFWTYDIKGESFKLNDLFTEDAGRKICAYRFAFQHAACAGNKTATEYFLQKLTPLEREESFAWYVECVANKCDRIFFPGVLCFLLSQMSEEQQVKVLKGNPYHVLSCLLVWPWQSLFMEAANRTWDFISEQQFVMILLKIVDKIRQGFKDCNYHKLFGKFWEQGPSTCKKYFIGRCASHGFLLQDLFKLAGKENIRLILKDAAVDEKEAIIFQKGKNICQNLIHSDKWDLLKFFIDEFLSSEDIMIKFNEEFKRHINYPSRQSLMPENFTKFFQILDDLISKNSKKRDVEEGTCSPAKRLK